MKHTLSLLLATVLCLVGYTTPVVAADGAYLTPESIQTMRDTRKRGDDPTELCEESCKDFEKTCKEVSNDAEKQCKDYKDEEKACKASCDDDKACEKTCKSYYKEWEKLCKKDVEDWEEECKDSAKECKSSCKDSFIFVMLDTDNSIPVIDLTPVEVSTLSIDIVINFTYNHIYDLPVEAFAGFQPEQVEEIPPEALEALSPEQALELTFEARQAFSIEQIEYMQEETVEVLAFEECEGDECEEEGNEDIACIEIYDPVCGMAEDGDEPETFSNMCFLEAEDAELLYEGECGDEPPPIACTMEYMPVCGEMDDEFETFGNMCQLEAEEAELVHEGECDFDLIDEMGNPSTAPDMPDYPNMPDMIDEDGNPMTGYDDDDMMIEMPDMIQLIGFVRDLPANHPDVEGTITGVQEGCVESSLDEEFVLPVAVEDNPCNITALEDWYLDELPGRPHPIMFEYEEEGDTYSFLLDEFFPIDDEFLGNEGRQHNYHFTYEAHAAFISEPDQFLTVGSDDDLWVFLDGELIIDLGGIHNFEEATVEFDDFGLETGDDYMLSFFFAERRTSSALLAIETNAMLESALIEMCEDDDCDMGMPPYMMECKDDDEDCDHDMMECKDDDEDCDHDMMECKQDDDCDMEMPPHMMMECAEDDEECKQYMECKQGEDCDMEMPPHMMMECAEDDEDCKQYMECKKDDDCDMEMPPHMMMECAEDDEDCKQYMECKEDDDCDMEMPPHMMMECAEDDEECKQYMECKKDDDCDMEMPPHMMGCKDDDDDCDMEMPPYMEEPNIDDIDFPNLTVELASNLSLNIIVNLTAEQVAQIPVDAMAGFDEQQIAYIPPKACKGLTKQHVEKIKHESARGFQKQQVQYVKSEAVSGFKYEHIEYFKRETVSGFNLEQIESIEPEKLGGFTPDNIGGLATEVVEEKGIEILGKLEEHELPQIPQHDVSWILLNSKVEPVELPQPILVNLNIEIHPDTGHYKLPTGKLRLPPMKMPELSVPEAVELPEIPDFNSSLNVSGFNQTVIHQVNQTFVNMNFGQFTSVQNNGIFKVQGTGEFEHVKYNFIPDENGFETVEEGTPEGITVDKGGRIILVTSTGLKTRLLPAPRDPEYITRALPGCSIKMDKRGITRLQVPQLNRTLFGVFDSELEIAEPELSVGINIVGTRGIDERAVIVYEDGFKQTMRPAIADLDLLVTAREGLMDAGRYGNHFMHSGGHIYMVYGEKLGRVVPTFDVDVDIDISVTVPTILPAGDDDELAVLITPDGERQTFMYEIIGEADEYDDYAEQDD